MRVCIHIRSCDTCTSGLPDCEGSLCSFLTDAGYRKPSLVVSAELEMYRVGLLQLGVCPTPLIVAVGGGGRSGYTGNEGAGGGGSGYVEFVELALNQSFTQFVVNAGSAGEPSSVTVVATNGEVISAEGGGDGFSYYGGEGYTGGGGGGYPTG